MAPPAKKTRFVATADGFKKVVKKDLSAEKDLEPEMDLPAEKDLLTQAIDETFTDGEMMHSDGLTQTEMIHSDGLAQTEMMHSDGLTQTEISEVEEILKLAPHILGVPEVQQPEVEQQQPEPEKMGTQKFYGEPVSKTWKLSEKESITVTLVNREVTVILSSKPLWEINITSNHKKHDVFDYFKEEQLAPLRKGLWKMKYSGNKSNFTHTERWTMLNMQMKFSFETRQEQKGIRIKHYNVTDELLSEGVFISLEAAEKLRRVFKYVEEHARLLGSQLGHLTQIYMSLVNIIIEFPQVKSLLREYKHYSDYNTFLGSVIESVGDAVKFITRFGLKSHLSSLPNFKDGGFYMNWNSVYLNCVSDVGYLIHEFINLKDAEKYFNDMYLSHSKELNRWM